MLPAKRKVGIKYMPLALGHSPDFRACLAAWHIARWKE